LFFNQLRHGYEKTNSDLINKGSILVEEDNLWHRVAGPGTQGMAPNAALIAETTRKSAFQAFTREKEWVAQLRHESGEKYRLIALDNAETAYFIQSLAEISTEKFADLRGKPALYQLAAERFVRLCRSDLRRCLFFMFTNNLEFALHFEGAVNEQHKGLISITDLPMPEPAKKEEIIRTNTNRLNRVSYWHCLDRAGPEAKAAVRAALATPSTNFPDTFESVNSAIRGAGNLRAGRHANRCTLTLAVLGGAHFVPHDLIDRDADKVLFESTTIALWRLGEGWASRALPGAPRECQMLESEWHLRVLYLGNDLVAYLLSDNVMERERAKCILDDLLPVQGEGTTTSTKAGWVKRVAQEVEAIPRATTDLETFWNQNQSRSQTYEAALKSLYPNYNTGGRGYLSYRPDLVLGDYEPCSLLGADNEDQLSLNAAIQRRANAVEFTAQKRPTTASLTAYLATKLRNYIAITRDQ